VALQHPDRVIRLAILNVLHPMVLQHNIRINPRQLLKSWYALFFQIPWLPEFLKGCSRGEPKPSKRSYDWCQARRPTDGCSSGWFRPEGHDGSTPKCALRVLLPQAALWDPDGGRPSPPDGLPENALSSAGHKRNCT
jgi:hypothetical protein